MQFMAPWVPSFTKAVQSHLESSPFVTVSFATVDRSGNPKVRTCVYRGFLFDDRKTNVLTVTTDTRMDKFEHLQNNSSFEACFWFPTTNEQFRVSGHAAALTAENADTFDGVHNYPLVSPSAVQMYSSSADLSSLGMTPTPSMNTDGTANNRPTSQEWRSELDNKWNTLSTKLRASFRKPDPGSPLTPEKRKLLDSISRGVDGSNEEDGKKNYAVLVLAVDKVDYTHLTGHNDLRYIYERFDTDQWTEDEVCP